MQIANLEKTETNDEFFLFRQQTVMSDDYCNWIFVTINYVFSKYKLQNDEFRDTTKKQPAGLQQVMNFLYIVVKKFSALSLSVQTEKQAKECS